jgi:hypothetical protein
MRSLLAIAALGAVLASPALAASTAPNAAQATVQSAPDRALWTAAQRACAKSAGTITMIQAHRACVRAVHAEASAQRLAAAASSTLLSAN